MAHSRLYIKLMNSREWKAARAQALVNQPLCVRCLKQGYYTAARCVHHVIPVESGKTEEECRYLAFNPGNLQPLCYQCHADIHNADRYTTKEQHQQREEERLAVWAEKMRKRREEGHADTSPTVLTGAGGE